MRTAPPPLLPLFRSRGQARLLARLFVPNGDDSTLTELAREIGVAKSRVSEELDRLEAAGLVTSRRLGSARIVRANPDSPFYEDLRSLLMKAFGPTTLLERRLKGVVGINEAFVYGSWAARYLGETGEAPADVDVLIVGSPQVREVRRSSRAAGRELGLEVNTTILSDEEWADHANPFVRTVRSRPLVKLNVGNV